ncbi:MAG: 16S rRNA (uracil(1498)-N(3))-methyltransferase [Chroococcales cyanobacterium]
MQRLVIERQQRQEDQIFLTAEQSHYLMRVLRLEDGDRFIAMDGLGNAWIAELSGETAQIVENFNPGETELSWEVILMIALPKQGFDDVVRCCTELGVTTIVPVISDRTILKPSPNKIDRWRKIAQEAAEQSERQIVPNILDPIPFSQALFLFPSQGLTQQYICVARKDAPHLLSYLNNQRQMTNQEQNRIIVATGCEGGWTPEEVEKAIAANFQPVSLGRRILRAVTAPIVTLSLIAAFNESNDS